MRDGISVFLCSALVAALVFGVERLAGISHGFHPDSLFYIDNFYLYQRPGWGALLNFNNMYYEVVGLFNGNVGWLVALNIVVFSLTNVIIARLFGVRLPTVSLYALLIMFLPYRLHLASHVLKDTMIIGLTVLTFFGTFKAMPLFAYMLGAFRIVAVAITVGLRFLPRRPLYVVLACFAVMTTALLSREFAGVILERGEADMGGREFLAMPLQGATNVFLILVRSLFWPLAFKTGFYPLLTGNAVILVIALEQLIALAISLRTRNLWVYVLSPGTLAMLVISLLVNSFGAYLRYIYPFFIIDLILLCLAASGRSFRPKNISVKRPKPAFRRRLG